ncbi:MAG TPA: hypothetical protein VME43_08430 [Bryobacteraceae bacterium]|nr:hypothetical protein [Bryobacteraceae bacterium]
MRLWGIAVALCIGQTMVNAQAPAADQRNGLLEKARQISLAYSRTLPDFLCTQMIRRSVRWQENGMWTPVDTLTVQVTYSQQRESYKLLQRNGQATNQSYEAVAGATTVGEFGSMLRWIFDPASHTEFAWQDRAGPHHAAVLHYQVGVNNTRYEVVSGTQATFAGYHGVVDIDPQTAQVLRATMVADLPKDFPIRESSTTVEYGLVKLDGRDYFLPVHAEADAADVPHDVSPQVSAPPTACCDWSRAVSSRRPAATGLTSYRNQITFRGYKRFTVDSHLIAQ